MGNKGNPGGMAPAGNTQVPPWAQSYNPYPNLPSGQPGGVYSQGERPGTSGWTPVTQQFYTGMQQLQNSPNTLGSTAGLQLPQATQGMSGWGLQPGAGIPPQLLGTLTQQQGGGQIPDGIPIAGQTGGTLAVPWQSLSQAPMSPQLSQLLGPMMQKGGALPPTLGGLQQGSQNAGGNWGGLGSPGMTPQQSTPPPPPVYPQFQDMGAGPQGHVGQAMGAYQSAFPGAVTGMPRPNREFLLNQYLNYMGGQGGQSAQGPPAAQFRQGMIGDPAGAMNRPMPPAPAPTPTAPRQSGWPAHLLGLLRPGTF